MPEVEIEDITAKKTFKKPLLGIIKKYINKISKKIKINRWRFSLYILKLNCLVIISKNKKKLSIGKSKTKDIAKICELLYIIFDKLLVGINPPAEIIVKDKLTESSNLKSAKESIKIIKRVEKE